MKLTLSVSLIIGLLYSSGIFSQKKDSLYKALTTNSVNDSAKTCNALAIAYRLSDQDSAVYFATLGRRIAIATHNAFEQGQSENELGIQYHIKAKYDLALAQYQKAMKLYESLSDQKDKVVIRAIASTYQNMGILHFDQGRTELSIKYYSKAIDLHRNINNEKALAGLYSNIAIIYSNRKEHDKALDFQNKALDIRQRYADSAGIALSYGGLAIVYYDLKQFDKAIDINLQKLAMEKRWGNKRDIVFTYNNLGGCYLELKKYPQARACFETGIAIAKETENYFSLQDLYYNLADLYEKTGHYKEALAVNKDYMQARDSMFKIESVDKTLEMEAKYETEKKELQIQNQSLEIDAKEKQNAQKSQIIWLGALALIGSGFFGIVAFINFRKTKKANLIIENQKMQVELKNEEVTHQKELVEEKQKEIIDSINYAKRIQQAVLTGEDVWNKVSKEHFILFKPKDIVSGDFYWAYNTPNGRSVFALADCTGHGVPGGFMSMLGNSFLNEIVVENKIFKADQILNKLRSKIIAALEQKGMTEQKDGMDISLCVWNKLDNTLEFAGANNPLWIMRASGALAPAEIIEYKADKMPIGTYLETEVPFSSTVIQLQKGDVIYLSTDGYADQFGGDKGKKMKYRPFMNLLLRISAEEMNGQKTALDQAFGEWKKHYDQVDDVSVIGIRV
jgi:serine phosphatase RsbU (regulator of sigma subunit)